MLGASGASPENGPVFEVSNLVVSGLDKEAWKDEEIKVYGGADCVFAPAG